MSLKLRIQDDMKQAMKARAADDLAAIRLLLAAMKQREVDERIELDDAAVVAIIDKLCKQRRESITQFDAAGRTDLSDKERAELVVLSRYLPEQLSDEQIDAAITKIIAAHGATGIQALGPVMAKVKAELAGKCDMSVVSQKVKAKLTA